MRTEAHALAALARFPEALAAQLDAIEPDTLDWAPASWEGCPSEHLTIRQQLCHLRDIEIDGYAERFRRLLGEDDPLLPSIDGYALVESRGYDATDPQVALAAFVGGRGRTLALLDGLTPERLGRRGRFEGYGQVTVLGLLHFLVSHDQQHLAGIQWLLGMRAGEAA
jgi:hypothetical protein